MTKKALEIVEFTLNKTITDEQFLEKIEATRAFVSSLDGFITRHTAKNSDGVWVDVVQWQDLISAQLAAKQFETAEAVKEFMMMIDFTSIRMQHFAIENTM